MKKKPEIIKCHGCLNFYITYKLTRPYGCKAYGFISKKMPSQIVFETSGINCAYRKNNNIV